MKTCVLSYLTVTETVGELYSLLLIFLNQNNVILGKKSKTNFLNSVYAQKHVKALSDIFIIGEAYNSLSPCFSHLTLARYAGLNEIFLVLGRTENCVPLNKISTRFCLHDNSPLVIIIKKYASLIHFTTVINCY